MYKRQVGLRLALIGSIKDEILNVDELAVELVKFIKAEYPGLLAQRYEVSEENDIKMCIRDSFKVVKQFTKSVQERAIGQDVMNGLNPGQMVIKIVNEEMIKLMGSETTEIAFRPGKELI